MVEVLTDSYTRCESRSCRVQEDLAKYVRGSDAKGVGDGDDDLASGLRSISQGFRMGSKFL
jgi:hypothetical protein